MACENDDRVKALELQVEGLRGLLQRLLDSVEPSDPVADAFLAFQRKADERTA